MLPKIPFLADYRKKDEITELNNNVSKKVGEVSLFVDNADELHTDDLSRMKIDELDAYVAEYEKFAEGFSSNKAIVVELQGLGTQLSELGAEVPSSISKIENKLSSSEEASVKRKEEFKHFRETLVDNDKVCKDFAEAAQNFNGFLEVQKEKAAKASDNTVIEETFQILKDVSQTLETNGGELLQKLEELNQKIDSRHIIENPYTQSTLRSLKSTFDAFVLSHKKKTEAVEKQIQEKAVVVGISKEDYKEFKESFEFFDKDKDGKLNALDFFGVLSSLPGESPTEESAKKILEDIDMDHDGLINFEEYTKYLVAKRSVSDTPESYRDAFSTIAQNKEYITEEDMRRVNMSPEKIHYLTSQMPRYENTNVNGYDYRAWINRIHGKN